MATEIRMPKLGMTMTDGKIVEWLKAEGDSVAMDEPIFIVANDKVNIDVESQAEGVLLKIVAEEGDVIPVGDVVAYIGQAGEEIAEGGAEKAPEPEAQEAEAKAEAAHGRNHDSLRASHLCHKRLCHVRNHCQYRLYGGYYRL